MKTNNLSITREIKLAGWAGFVLLLRPIMFYFISQSERMTISSTTGFLYVSYSIISFITAFYFLFIPTNSFSRIILTKTPIKWFLFYTLFGTLSCIWSYDPLMTILRSFDCISMLVLLSIIIGCLLDKYDSQTTLDWIFLFVILQFFSELLTGIKLNGFEFRLFKYNQFISTIFFFLSIGYCKRKFIKYLIILFGFFSTSATAYIGMLLGSICFFLGNRIQIFLASFFVIITTICIFTYGGERFLMNTVFIERAEVSLSQTSGRDYINEMAMDKIKESPILGYGFVAGEVNALKDATGTYYNSAHNGFVSAMLGTGIFGFILLIIFFAAQLLDILKINYDLKLRAYLLSSFCVILIHTLGNPGLGAKVYGTWIPRHDSFNVFKRS